MAGSVSISKPNRSEASLQPQLLNKSVSEFRLNITREVRMSQLRLETPNMYMYQVIQSFSKNSFSPTCQHVLQQLHFEQSRRFSSWFQCEAAHFHDLVKAGCGPPGCMSSERLSWDALTRHKVLFSASLQVLWLIRTLNADVDPAAAVRISLSAFGATGHRTVAVGQKLCLTCAKVSQRSLAAWLRRPSLNTTDQ